MSVTIDEIHGLSQELFEEIRQVRQHIHRHPELSFQEKETSGFVAAFLKREGISFRSIAGTGLIGEIKGNNAGSHITMLRSELDALPITEKNETDYTSLNTGVMHACGHDVHTASLLGALKILNSCKDRFEGTVKFIIQPGEEKLPGGASMVIKEGGMRDPAPASIMAQHVMPELEMGKVGFRPGLYMASADEIYITVKGKGGHGAMPHHNVDPVLISAHLIIALQQVVSRWANPAIPSILSFGKVVAEGATNVIPDEVRIAGTFRTYNEDWRAEAHKRMKELAISLAEGMGGTVDFDIHVGYPFLKNDEALTEKMREAAITYMGADNVVHLEMRPTAEDFGYYTHVVPGCFYRLGTGNKAKGITAAVHNPHFDIDEEALKTGMGLLAWLALTELKGIK